MMCCGIATSVFHDFYRICDTCGTTFTKEGARMGSIHPVEPTIPRVCSVCGVEFLGYGKENKCFACHLGSTRPKKGDYAAH